MLSWVHSNGKFDRIVAYARVLIIHVRKVHAPCTFAIFSNVFFIMRLFAAFCFAILSYAVSSQGHSRHLPTDST